MSTTLKETLRTTAPPSGPSLLGDVHEIVDNLDMMLKAIPGEALRECAGVCFLISRKGGIIISGIQTSGFLISRLPASASRPQNWSGPCALRGGGVSLGAEFGLSTTYHVYVVGDRSQLDKFAAAGQLELGASLSLAGGTTQKHTEGAARVGTKGPSVTQAFTFSKGTQIGAGLTTELLRLNSAGNAEFYEGIECVTEDLLDGRVGTGMGDRRPHVAMLYRMLDEKIMAAPASASVDVQ